MYKIIVRIFPKNRRASFSSKEIAIDSKSPTVLDLFNSLNDLAIGDYFVSRGTTIISPSDQLVNGETLNIMPK
jgi:hypothetical protein